MDSPLMEDEIILCKGCSEPLEEGKAFELAGQRWHLPCFRCSTCGNVLDADANLLLLGDGNLICHSCTYSCSACGQKIEDLAILTGDQAFCSGCFRCRNCKKKIENLRYARTSQGIFCMSCHETLMARRRKKTRAPQKPGSAPTREKALPSLPPGAASSSAFSPDLAELETPPVSSYAPTPSATSPPQRQDSRRELAPGGASRGASPYSDDLRPDGPTLPASTYGESRPSNDSRESEDGPDHGFLPMAFDPSPVVPPITRKQVPQPQDPSPSQLSDGRSRDYFGNLPSGSGYRDLLREDYRPGSSRSGSTERDSGRAGSRSRVSPHIMYQDNSRYNKENEPPSSATAARSPYAAPIQADEEPTQSKELDSRAVNQNDGFKLQEAPRSKKNSLRRSKEGKLPVSLLDTSPKNEQVETLASETPSSTGSPNSSINPFDDPKRKETGWTSVAARPARSDSLAGAARKARSPAVDLKTPIAASAPTQSQIERNTSVSSVPSSFADAKESLSRDNSVSKAAESSPTQGSPQAPPPPSRATARLNKAAPNEDFAAPRVAPIPPPTSAPIERHTKKESSSSIPSMNAKLEEPMTSPALHSAHLPKHSIDGTFSMEEEMARIMKGDRLSQSQRLAAEAGGPSMLRKMSNAVKHGRSFSDRAIGTTSKSSASGGLEISSPVTISSPLLASPTGRDSNDQLAAQLKRAQQRIAELESEVHRFDEKMNSSTEIKAANNELREKRTTIVVLDTQRELVVRELEAMTEHLTKAKDSNQPLDLNVLKSDILKDFAESLQKLKDSLSSQIEDLIHKRNELQDEISNLIQMKDKGFQEYEELSNKNSQLQEMNNQILHNIQDMYKSNRGVNGVGSAPTANGLGIYHPGARIETGYSEVRNLNLVNTDSSMPNLLQETDPDTATLLSAPKVVNIRKEGQAKKFNWRKGGEKMAKNVTKGIKGAFGEKGAPYRDYNENAYAIGMPYNQMQTGAAPGSDQASLGSRGGGLDPNRSGSSFGFFTVGGQKAGGVKGMKDNSSTNLATDGSVLFGSELSDRCEFEKRVIPNIVSRCVEEVESRGMDAEGIYRKSGGTGQVKIVQQGFEKDNNYDLSDDDLDIHAVTSTLKQYLRKLPTPLITYDVYDPLLEAGRIQDKEKQSVSLRMIVADLPEHHRDCLEYLIQHLARVMANESANLMTPLNLAVVFAPTIMRPQTIEREMSDMQAQRIALQALLEHNATVFPDE